MGGGRRDGKGARDGEGPGKAGNAGKGASSVGFDRSAIRAAAAWERENAKALAEGKGAGNARGAAKGDGKGDAKGAGKRDAKGAGKGEAKGKGDAKGAGKGEGKSSAKGDGRDARKGDAKGGAKGDWKGGAKGDSKGSAKGDWKGAAKGDSKGAAKGDYKGSAKGYAKGDGKGDKGGAKGDFGMGGAKGKSGAPRYADSRETSGPALSGAKTVQELEAEMLINKLSNKSKERPDMSKQPLEAKGSHCEVKKHSEMGCAVVTMESESGREVVLKRLDPNYGQVGDNEERHKINIGEHSLQVRPHFDKAKGEQIKTDIFVAWGRQAEKQNPLSAAVIAAAFDDFFRQGSKVAPSHALITPAQLLQPPMGTGPPPAPPAFSPTAYSGLHATVPNLPGMPGVPSAMPNPLLEMMQRQLNGQPNPQQAAAAMMAHMAQQAAMTQQAHAAQQLMAQQAALVAMQQAAMQQAAMQQAYAMQQAQANAAAMQTQQSASSAAMTTPRGPAAQEMRADAPAFTYSPSPQPQPQQQQQQPQSNNGNSSFNEPEQYAPLAAQYPPVSPERRALTIINPKSGQPIDVDAPKLDFELPKVPGHKPMAIIDPNSGKSVDPIGLNFTPPKQSKSGYSIIDPSSGDSIKSLSPE
mmetsp:Transcript_96107/g.248566  ORF Transcript_96107/g.248566 Transcript_96107/m.248566 type:complete len:637 (-) Transcript_96107:106-2016(-)